MPATMVRARYVIWWVRKLDKASATGQRRVWILVPGGMSDGNDFYIRQSPPSSVVAQIPSGTQSVDSRQYLTLAPFA